MVVSLRSFSIAQRLRASLSQLKTPKRNKNTGFVTHMHRQIYTSSNEFNAKLANIKPNDGGGGEKKKWWSTSFETKVITSILLGVVSHYVSAHMDKKQARKEVQLERVNRQIRELYGPLYGNRLVQQTSYRGVVGDQMNLKTYLRKAEAEKNGEMIEKWRSFVWNVLYPLDKEAQALICDKAHLIASSEFPEEFKIFLTHFARLQFIMEEWKTPDGRLQKSRDFTEPDFLERNNASGVQGLCRTLDHVETKCRELREQQKRLIVELSAPDDQNVVTGVINKFR